MSTNLSFTKMKDIERAVHALDRLGVEALKDKQKKAICIVVGGQDCFVTNGVWKNALLRSAPLCLRLSSQANSWIIYSGVRFPLSFFDDGPG